jgi:phosphoglycerol transferase MdoB-like AlkP superfamily enzyme
MRAATIASTLVITTHLFARMKIHYYKDNLVASDLYIVADSSNWETLLHYPLAGFVVIVIVVALFASFYSHRLEQRSRAHLRIGALVIAIISGAVITLYRNDSQAADAWVASLPKGQGTFADLIFSSRAFSYSPPMFEADDAVFLEKAAHIAQAPREQSQHPDIVVMLQESTVNPALFDLPNAQLPELRMFKPNQYTRAQSLLRVHTSGGGTWLSEFALLSGLISRDFGATAPAVYYTVTPHLHTSLIKVLKENGYHTVVLTTFNKSAYHASSAYQDFGFDEILQPQDLGYPADSTQNLWNIESGELNEYAKKVLRTRTNKPLFLFMLTMKEHGPYDVNTEFRYGLERATPDTALAHKLSDFFFRIETLSKATEEFSEFLMQRKRPSMFLYFGDHQPGLGSANVKYTTRLPDAEYLTQFVLRDNLEPGIKQEFEVFDLSLVGGLLLERAHLKPDLLFTANIQMRKLSQGRLKDYPDQKLIESYKHYIYHTLATAG